MLSDFEKEKVFWTKKMNLNLVTYIKSKPYIWNRNHPKYTSIKLRDRAYAQFASKYGDNFSGLAVKERWTNIRSTFASYVRKYMSKSNSSQPYKVNWHLWDACQFLQQNNLGMTTQECLKQDINLDCDMDIKDTSIPDEDTGTEHHSDNDASTSNPKTNCKTLARDIASILQSFQNNTFGLDHTRNGKIGSMVTERLSKMAPNDAAEVSVKIMEILQKCQRNSTNDGALKRSDSVSELFASFSES